MKRRESNEGQGTASSMERRGGIPRGDLRVSAEGNRIINSSTGRPSIHEQPIFSRDRIISPRTITRRVRGIVDNVVHREAEVVTDADRTRQAVTTVLRSETAKVHRLGTDASARQHEVFDALTTVAAAYQVESGAMGGKSPESPTASDYKLVRAEFAQMRERDSASVTDATMRQFGNLHWGALHSRTFA